MAETENQKLVRYDGSPLDSTGYDQLLSKGGAFPVLLGFSAAALEMVIRQGYTPGKSMLRFAGDALAIFCISKALNKLCAPKGFNPDDVVIDRSGKGESSRKLAQNMRDHFDRYGSVDVGLVALAGIATLILRDPACYPILGYAIGRINWNISLGYYPRGWKSDKKLMHAADKASAPHRWSVRLEKTAGDTPTP